MEFLSTGRKQTLTISAVALIVLGGLCVPPAVPPATAQTKSPAKVMQMRTLTTNEIIAKVGRGLPSPETSSLSPPVIYPPAPEPRVHGIFRRDGEMDPRYKTGGINYWE